jgi:predicted AlkP superfamily phosphohydrolase/phosphomutase
VVLDAPYTHPHLGFSGVQIFEWGTWAHYWRPMGVPEGFFRQFVAACGDSPIGLEANQVGLGPLDLPDLRRRLVRAAELKTRAARWLMTQVSWDLFFLVYGETHPAAHYFWSGNGSGAGAEVGSAGTFLLEVYQAIDRGLGDLLAGIGDDTTVILVSGDGVGPNHAGWHLLPTVLRRLGFTAGPGPDAPGGALAARQDPARKSLLKRLRDAVPSDLRRSVSRHLPARWRDSLMSRWATADIDWSGTRAFCLPTDLEGIIRVNLRGREPLGVVEPGKPYEDVCRELSGALTRLVNPRTGRSAVRRVVCADAALPGERRDYLPDLIVLWADEAAIDEVQSPEVGVVRGQSPDARTGTHRPPGFVLVHGPGAGPGPREGRGHIVDFAPTILARFGLSSAPAMTGRIFSDLGVN